MRRTTKVLVLIAACLVATLFSTGVPFGTAASAKGIGPQQPAGTLLYTSPANGWLSDSSTLLQTNNGGVSWRTSYASQAVSVFFLNREIGWALISSKGLIATRDGGRHWGTLFGSRQATINSFAFTNEHSGWAVTARGLLLHSVDGGSHWTIVRSPTAVSSVCASRAGGVWIGSNRGSVYHSSNGESWGLSLSVSSIPKLIPEPIFQYTPLQISCSRRNVWAVYRSGGNLDSQNQTIEMSNDDGHHWHVLTRQNFGTLADFGNVQLGTAAWFLTYCGPCTNGDVRLAVGDGHHLRAKAVTVPAGVYASPYGASFLTKRVGWIALIEYPVAEAGSSTHQSLVVIKTENGGASWKLVSQIQNTT